MERLVRGFPTLWSPDEEVRATSWKCAVFTCCELFCPCFSLGNALNLFATSHFAPWLGILFRYLNCSGLSRSRSDRHSTANTTNSTLRSSRATRCSSQFFRVCEERVHKRTFQKDIMIKFYLLDARNNPRLDLQPYLLKDMRIESTQSGSEEEQQQRLRTSLHHAKKLVTLYVPLKAMPLNSEELSRYNEVSEAQYNYTLNKPHSVNSTL